VLHRSLPHVPIRAKAGRRARVASFHRTTSDIQPIVTISLMAPKRFQPAIILLLSALLCAAQSERHGRKYVAPAPAAHIQVTVTKAFNGKPVANAAVIFHPLKDGKDEGNMEIKTNRDGVAILDLIPIGDTVRLQVVADGFQTFGQDYTIDSDTKLLDVKLEKPAKQSSLYPPAGSANPPTPPAK
jgi:hypothetical protein